MKPVQILGRLSFWAYHPAPSLRNVPARRACGSAPLVFPEHSPRMHGPAAFQFLNETRELSFPEGWNQTGVPKLWLYNLHYFEDLLAQDARKRETWHRELIGRWVDDNLPFAGTGWEPYPLSLRIGNWIKWSLSGNELETSWSESLALQAEYLYHRIEWHLLGNHVLENAKALVLAGCFFKGGHADKWRNKGLRILDGQLDEQVLADGGHLERSPMYHSLVLEGVLDLVQISEFYGVNGEWAARWRELARGMVDWLGAMTHPDKEIAFFNDAAFDVALPPERLFEYARRLGIDPLVRKDVEGIRLLEDSGYIKATRGRMAALLDTAPVGPDYQPGHAHADTLTFELSVDGQRVLVNSGTSVYGVSEERSRQRGTAAHNAVVVDDENSSEVWSGFRVARRARPFDVSVRGSGETWQVTASHDGYRRLLGGVAHSRMWLVADSELTVHDLLVGSYRRAVSYFHFHPDVLVELVGTGGLMTLAGGERIRFSVMGGTPTLSRSSYHPKFGETKENLCLEVAMYGSETSVIFHITG